MNKSYGRQSLPGLCSIRQPSLPIRAILWSVALLSMLSMAAWVQPAFAQAEISNPDEQVIRYHSDEGLADPVARLQRQLSAGEARLKFEAGRGYLDSLLQALGISPSSQGLVFSKSSSQADHTSPRTPRAVYYNENVAVGWVPGASVIDVAAVDPQRGPIFYILEQKTNGTPQFSRGTDCLRCHENAQTLNVPGLLVRSFYTAADGTMLAKVPRFVNGHSSPLEQRWGGWYVTGTHENDVHLGNIFSSDRPHPENVDLKAGANVTDLRNRFDTAQYISRDSDIVALLVLEHQSRMQNAITRASYETKLALDPGVADGEKRPVNTGQRSVSPRIASAGEALLENLLFLNEAPLRGPVKGSPTFVADFERRGVSDSHGRSLRQLDLQKRLFKFPCSYMIYTAAFDGLPLQMKDYLWGRLDAILDAARNSPGFESIRLEDRRAVREILIDTKPEFAAWVRAHKNTAEISRSGKLF